MATDQWISREEACTVDPSSAPHGSVSSAIVDALLEITGEERGELTPLYEWTDPSALDEFVESVDAQSDINGPVAQFPYEEYTVTVYSSRDVVISSATPDGGESR